MLEPITHRERDPALEARDVVIHAARHVGGMNAFRPAIPLLFFQRAPPKFQPGVIEIKTPHIEAGHPDHHRRAISQLLEKIFVGKSGVGQIHGESDPTDLTWLPSTPLRARTILTYATITQASDDTRQ